MKLNTNKEQLAESKVLILYILSKIDKPVTNLELLDLVQSIEDMNYFYFQQFLTDLKENRYILEYEQEKQKYYAITVAGRETMKLTLDMLAGSIKVKVDRNLKNIMKKIENEESIYADFFPNKEDEFMINCGIKENNKKIFEVQVFSSSRDNSIKVIENWKKNATKIYPQIIELLNK